MQAVQATQSIRITQSRKQKPPLGRGLMVHLFAVVRPLSNAVLVPKGGLEPPRF